MRYHSARVVLGACLVAASVAAQAPASISSSALTGGSSRFEQLPDGNESALRTRPLGERLADDDNPTGYAQQVNPLGGAQQQDGNYTIFELFRLHHGEFMDRRERYTPQIDLRARILKNASIDHEPGSFDMLGYDFDMKIPAFISTESYLTFGAYYQGRRYVTSNEFGSAGNAPGNTFGDETLVGAGGVLGLGVFLDNNWLLEAETRPGVWSDLDDTLHHEDVDFPSMAQFTFRATDSFFFKFGARYNQVYADAPWLPILGFSWEVVEGFRVDILAPESIELSFWPSSSTGILLGANVTGAEYGVHTSEAINQRDELRVQEVVTYLGLVSRMNDHVSFMARGGMVVAGDYDLTNGTTGFDRAEGALSPGFFGEISFGITF